MLNIISRVESTCSTNKLAASNAMWSCPCRELAMRRMTRSANAYPARSAVFLKTAMNSSYLHEPRRPRNLHRWGSASVAAASTQQPEEIRFESKTFSLCNLTLFSIWWLGSQLPFSVCQRVGLQGSE